MRISRLCWPCIGAGVNVIEQDLDQGLSNFADNSFDTVVMTQTLQAVHYPHQLIDELLETRAEVSRGLVKTVASRAQTWGVDIVRLDLKDLVLPGDMKILFNQVIEAEKRAAAQNITRREEVAATRSQANTAKLLTQNPVLLRLKELDSLKELAERIDNLTVHIGGEEVAGQWLRHNKQD